MTTLKELKTEAKMSGLKGYSTMSRDQVQQLLRGEKMIKYRKNQKQTEFPLCQTCAITKL